jgi:tripartite-type tricarboxylate transporter receptor subunit TctC
MAGLQGEVDIAGGGVHEHIEHVRAGNLRMLQQTGATDLEVEGVGKLRSIGDAIPSLKPLLPLGGIYNLALKRDTPVDILKQIAVAWEKAFQSDAWNAVAKKKYFQTDIRIGEAADRRAAQVECLTADTFTRVQEQIGKPVRGTKELGLPNPNEFDAWWPPKGYKPRMA